MLTQKANIKRIPVQITMKSMNSSLQHLAGEEAIRDPFQILLEYGEMLPKEGVKSLPDYKVMAFLRVLQDYRKKLEEEERYLESKQAKLKFKKIARIELKRQMRKMQQRQTLELQKIEELQRN